MKTTKKHITIQLRKIYNAALSKSNDPLDCGRRDLAWDLIEGNAEFLADHYPSYSSSESIARIDDLSKIVNAYIDGGDSAAAQLLEEEFGGDAEHPSILERLINLEASCLLIARSILEDGEEGEIVGQEQSEAPSIYDHLSTSFCDAIKK